MSPRSTRYDKGRWQTQRDRFPLIPERPTPPFKPQVMVDVVSHVLSGLHLEAETHLLQIQACWPELVGPQIAAHAQPGRIAEKTLYVHVAHSIWLAELKRYEKTILGKLQERFSANMIRRVKLLLKPD